jgi:hypothetical protein
MQFRWPFPIKPIHQPVDETALGRARAELAVAELALDAARATYLRLQEARQAAKLRLQQSVLDDALHRYHLARQAARTLEQQNAVLASWTGTARRAVPGGTALTKG